MRGCLYEVKHPTLVGMSGISYLSEIPAETGEFRFVKNKSVYMKMNSSHPGQISRQRRGDLTEVRWFFLM